jgi:hypothetical protein
VRAGDEDDVGSEHGTENAEAEEEGADAEQEGKE